MRARQPDLAGAHLAFQHRQVGRVGQVDGQLLPAGAVGDAVQDGDRAQVGAQRLQPGEQRVVGAVLAAALGVYLVYALLFPERF